MQYCGIDIGGTSSFVFVSDDQGIKLVAKEVKTTKEEFQTVLKPLVGNGLKIAIEAGNQTMWIYEILVALGADVMVVNPNKVKAIALSRRKTDRIDAKLLCDLLRANALPSPVHMPKQECRELRGLLVARRQLVQSRTKLSNIARGMMRQEGIRLISGALSTFKGWEKALKGEYKHCHIQFVLTTYYESFRALTRSIAALEKQLNHRAKNDPRVTLLKSMPMVGLIASLTFVAAVDTVDRFSSSRQLVSYAGLAPTIRQSSERTQYGGISREGRSELRGVWIQIAHLIAMDKRGPAKPLRKWFEGIAERHGKKTALVALSRKLLTVAFQMLKTGELYDASKIGAAA